MSNSVKYRFLSLAVIAVMSIALAACGGDNSTGGSGSSGGQSNTDLLKQAAASMKAAKSYHLDMNGTAGGSQITLAGDVDVANNASNLTISAAGQNIQMVSVGSNAYLSTDGGTSFINAGGSASQITSGMSQFTSMWNNFNPADVDKSAANIKDGSPATDSINGATCKHMIANLSDLSSLSASGTTTATGTADLWAATDGSSICQVKVTTTDKATDITMKWSKLNSVSPIATPANVSGL